MLGPITLSDYDADRRCWKLRDKSVLGVRVATFYRVMHMLNMRELSRREGRMREMRRLFSEWAASFLTHTRHVVMQAAHEARAAVDRTGRREYVSARTRMRMTAPDLYREARRNAPRRVAVLGARRRVRLPSMVDTEIGARLV